MHTSARRLTPSPDPSSVELDDLARLRDVAQSPSVAGAVEAVRAFLGMEVAYTTHFVDGSQVFRSLSGDAESFGVAEGTAMPLEETYCHRVLSGRLPNLIPDVRGEDRAASLAITEQAGVGAFASVPLRFSDGALYGTLCAASHEPKADLGYRELQFLHVFARIISDQLERDLLERRAQELVLQGAVADALVAAVQARDSYTAEHSREVVELAGAVASELGLSQAEIRDVRQVALLHDIGKIAVPDAILSKAGPLTADEWDVMRCHPAYGAGLIGDCPGLDHLAPAIRAEHERWDGGGYPDGLAGEEIPLASRITLVCDAYHAMVGGRPYRPAVSPARALAEIERCSGTQFCPRAARALLDLAAADPRRLGLRRVRGLEGAPGADTGENAIAAISDPAGNGTRGVRDAVADIRETLMALISARVAVTGDPRPEPLSVDDQDDLIEAANRLGRVEADLDRRGGPEARSPA